MNNSNICSSGILSHIENSYPALSPSLQKIAIFALSSPGKLIGCTAAELSSELDVSEASIVRFCKVLGFKGFSDLKIKLAKNLGADNSEPVPVGITGSDGTQDVIDKVFRMELGDIRLTLEMLDMSAMENCLDMIALSNRIAFFGIGSSAIVADCAKEHFLHYGKLAHAEKDSISQIILANTLHKDDLAFAISISGQSSLTLQAMQIAKKNGARTVCLTQNPNSAIANLCDCVLIGYRRSKYIDDLGTVSRIVHTSIVDALAIAYAARNWEHSRKVTTANRRNYRASQFVKLPHEQRDGDH